MTSEEVQNLTVRECEEASQYKLNRIDYVELRKRFRDRLREALTKEITPQLETNLRKSQQFRENIMALEREELRKQLRPEIEKDLLPQLRTRVESELGAKAREEAIAKLRAEKPDAECKSTYSIYLREIETEAQTLAETASGYGDCLQNKFKLNKRIRQPVAVASWLGFLPMLAIMMSLGVGASSFTFWSILLPMVAFAIWMTTKYVAISDSLKQSISSERKVSSNYLQVVDMARRMRMAIVPNAQSVAEISEAIKRVANQKEELDAKFFPATKDLNENRKKVRVRVLDDLDPMDVLDAVESERFRPENIKKSA
jgi:hypothetical protein